MISAVESKYLIWSASFSNDPFTGLCRVEIFFLPIIWAILNPSLFNSTMTESKETFLTRIMEVFFGIFTADAESLKDCVNPSKDKRRLKKIKNAFTIKETFPVIY
jgi:hypothetical protein